MQRMSLYMDKGMHIATERAVRIRLGSSRSRSLTSIKRALIPARSTYSVPSSQCTIQNFVSGNSTSPPCMQY
ncbi:hypothetical protein X798_01131 [Onchocerca flexuosa]|uniref:Alpha-carbonic anhydrase domain-containing protein n=1 Tax=Onchocerca flexuosa TaxID=387005 RepID=A0A238C4J1_9BILA|nr:hypothetical protein X798_01131 [Onchocerca flexuosa]